MIAKQRYLGIQSIFGIANQYACLFLCLLSIAEEQTGHEVDFIEAYRNSISKGLIKPDFYVNDALGILKMLTKKGWTFTRLMKLPSQVPEKMYTVEKWYNPRTGYTHFKRRGYDTLDASVTVKEGSLIEYYTYTWR